MILVGVGDDRHSLCLSMCLFRWNYLGLRLTFGRARFAWATLYDFIYSFA
jgi:hypothetical protein